MRVIAIDPGRHGAIAYLGESKAWVWDLPYRDGLEGPEDSPMVDLEKLHAILANTDKVDVQIIEKPQWRMGISAKNAATAFFNFGRLTSLFKCPFVVHAAVWKKELALTSDKNLSLHIARLLFPELQSVLTLKKHEGRAEAVLLGEYARRTLAGF